ncbi:MULTISPECIES: phage tail protein [Budviciaceae]|uniref:Phage protein U n=1 Tax=Budvicia aquatica TaxID=82979 RepID=A0A2C6DLN0_9GAMM|nr:MULTISPECIES: phage tail protein [Budviciaceae]PHI29252.1 phage tail protein [Budvicia aquatica]VFS47469.1 Phage protein U [Budvicia aquatica]
MMMILGMFPFMLKTVPYQEFQQTKSWRFPTNNRVGKSPAVQFTGINNDTITLSGVLLPEFTGGRLSMFGLKTMADAGMAWPLIESSGAIYGMFVIESITENKSFFFKDGTARRIEFTINLKRTDDGLLDMLGSLGEKIAGLF